MKNEIRYITEQGKVRLEIVGSAEADPAAGMMSNLSPLGKMLLGKSAGETVSVQVGLEAPTLFRIVKIQPAQGIHYATV